MAEISNPIVAMIKQDFLDLLDRILPQHYLDPLKEIGPGYEALQAAAAIAERISKAVEILGIDSQIATANSGAYATGQVELYRALAPPADGELISGQVGDVGNLVAGAPVGQVRVTGLAFMSSASVGRFLSISNTGKPTNTGIFSIASYIDPTSVDVVNALGIVPDPNNGTIHWEEQNKTILIKAGTVVSTRSSRDFVTTVDITFNPFDLGPKTVPIIAVAPGYEWNVTGQTLAADGTILPGEITTIKTLVEDPPLLDTSIQVRQILSTTGGKGTALDALGNDRGIVRTTGEADADYRARIRALPDTITPAAMIRAVGQILRSIHATATFIETFSISYQTAWDGMSSAVNEYNPNLFVYDDPDTTGVPFHNRWLSESDYRGGVIFVVDAVQPLKDQGMIFDDTVMSSSDLVSSVTGGLRAVSAFDVPVTLGFGYLLGSYDGTDEKRRSLYKGIWDTLQAIKPGGVSVAVELKGE